MQQIVMKNSLDATRDDMAPRDDARVAQAAGLPKASGASVRLPMRATQAVDYAEWPNRRTIGRFADARHETPRD